MGLGWRGGPGAVTGLGGERTCRGRKPGARCPGSGGVTAPDDGETLDADFPAATSIGLVAATPENSCTLRAATAEDVVRTVPVVTDAALAEYPISPSELWPETA